MSLTSRQKKQFRQIAHHLDAIVTLADHPISDGVLQETERALTDHELIKVKLSLLDRADRQSAGDELAQACAAEVVQRIGKMIILYRNNPKAEDRLSNVARYS